MKAAYVFLFAGMLWAQGGFEQPGEYEIVNLQSRKALDLDGVDQTTVVQSSPRAGMSQRWSIEHAGAGLYYIRSAANGRALEADGDRVFCRRFDHNPRQRWRIEEAKDASALIVSRSGSALEISNGEMRDGARVRTGDFTGAAEQRFLLRRK